MSSMYEGILQRFTDVPAAQPPLRVHYIPGEWPHLMCPFVLTLPPVTVRSETDWNAKHPNRLTQGMCRAVSTRLICFMWSLSVLTLTSDLRILKTDKTHPLLYYQLYTSPFLVFQGTKFPLPGARRQVISDHQATRSSN